MPALDNATDEQLMGLLRDGQQDALSVLVERYQNDVFRFSLHYLRNVDIAKEMAQETFLRVYTARERFDVSRRFKPWLLCIARNLCLNELKRKKTVHMETLEEYVSSARGEDGEVLRSGDDAPDEILMNNERHRALMRAVNDLPGEAAEIVKMRYFERMSAREIAEVIDSTEGAVRTRLHRILKQLRNNCAPMKEHH